MTLPVRCYYVIVLLEMSLVCLHLPSHRGEKSMWGKVTPNEFSQFQGNMKGRCQVALDHFHGPVRRRQGP